MHSKLLVRTILILYLILYSYWIEACSDNSISALSYFRPVESFLYIILTAKSLLTIRKFYRFCSNVQNCNLVSLSIKYSCSCKYTQITNYLDNVGKEFLKLAVTQRVDIFRIFDSMNYFPCIALGIEDVGSSGGVLEASFCYTSDTIDATRIKYTLDYYLKLQFKFFNSIISR